MKLSLHPLLLLLLLTPTLTLAQIWGFGGEQLQPFGQSTQPRRLQRGQQLQNDCQINQLTAAEPSKRIESEAGVTEIWEAKNQQELRCAGVTVIRHQIEPKGLALPHYVNAPILTYVVNGRGVLGVTIPGCPETYESGLSEQPFSDERRERERGDERRERERERGDERRERGSSDQHQKVRRFRQGEIIALPAGVSKWVYNDGQERLTLVSLYDTNNFQNQLDENLKAFFLAGNPQARGGEQGRHQEQMRPRESRRHGKHGGQEEDLGQNIFSGFDDELLAEAFGVDQETIRSLKGQNDNRGAIVRVERDLKVLSPEWDPEEERRETRHHRGGGDRHGREEDWREKHHRGGRQGERDGSNGVEQTLCNLRLKENIDNPENADEFNPHGGRLTSLNSHKLPILNFLQLSAEKVNLYKNAILAPHWRINAHTIAYFTRGEGRIQVVNHEGRLVFDDTVNEGQLLVIPQNFAVVKRAGREGLEWVSFLTNDESLINPLAGRISAIRGMPEEVVMNAYGVSRDEAKSLKYSRPELTVFSPSSRADRRGDEFSIV
ncbi:hypothetical protein vseg_014544 [Gypsophila vaccaria]